MKYKQRRKWQNFRKRWLKDNPPNHQGYYTCGICGQWVHISEVTLDHITPRSRRPDLRYNDNNIQPAHYLCNSIKGSKDGSKTQPQQSEDYI